MEITSEFSSEAKNVFSNKWVWIIGLGLGGAWLLFSHIGAKNKSQSQSQSQPTQSGQSPVEVPVPVVSGGGGGGGNSGSQNNIQSQALNDQFNLGLISAGINAMNSQLTYNATLLSTQASAVKNLVNACVQEANNTNT
ncbi:MAG TPA: hypothetical protein ENO40_04500, partial [Desulfurella acetivorans]|nr:hypothetical protein [Desulfurella acetivorans]